MGQRARCLLRAACTLGVLAALLLPSGCQALGALAYKLVGNPEVQAAYVPPQQPLLVLVESANSAGGESACNPLAVMLEHELAEHKVAPVVGQDKLQALRGRGEEEYRKMTIAAIGRAAGAKQVLYVRLEGCRSGPMAGCDGPGGNLQTKVRMIDTDADKACWPAEEAGYPVDYEVRPRAQSNTVTDVTVRDELLAGGANRIAKLFYTYRPEGNEAPRE